MKIVTEQWFWGMNGIGMVEAGYHIDPPMFVVRMRREEMKPIAVQDGDIKVVGERLYELNPRNDIEESQMVKAYNLLCLDKRRPQDFEPGFELLVPPG